MGYDTTRDIFNKVEVVSLDEKRRRAIEFEKEWEGTTSELKESKSFIDELVKIHGVRRKDYIEYEFEINKADGRRGRADAFWPGVCIFEMKSSYKTLDEAYEQVIEYIKHIPDEIKPKYIVVSNFNSFRVIRIKDSYVKEFKLENLHDNIDTLDFLAVTRTLVSFDMDVKDTIKASEKIGKLARTLIKYGYKDEDTYMLAIRLVTCLYADWTNIFPEFAFKKLVKDSRINGEDLGILLDELFEVLGTPINKRMSLLSLRMNEFPYLNGLFEEKTKRIDFNSEMRSVLIECCEFDWSHINPSIYGSLMQEMFNSDDGHRRNNGIHYTLEKNITKVLNPLFLDELNKEFNSITSKEELIKLQDKISKMVFLDPACGCGNFLAIAYRELRMIEADIIIKLSKLDKKNEDIDIIKESKISTKQFYGIEIEKFPALIANVVMWIMEHQCNMCISNMSGLNNKILDRMPLHNKANIILGDALKIDWNESVENKSLNYIFGNPPFLGSCNASSAQKEELRNVFENKTGCTKFDFVTAWFAKAAKLMNGTRIKSAFVSTNSIVEGNQSSELWDYLDTKYGTEKIFAYRTFKWDSEVKGKAQVYCVIIGFCSYKYEEKRKIYEDESVFRYVDYINHHLDDKNIEKIKKISKPICNVPKARWGSTLGKGSNYYEYSVKERDELIEKYPESEKYLSLQALGTKYLNAEKVYLLNLKGIEKSEYSHIQEICDRLIKIKDERMSSTSANKSDEPEKYVSEVIMENDYIFIPMMCSDNNKYLPMSILRKDVIPCKNCVVESGDLYNLGILSSNMHMIWKNELSATHGEGDVYDIGNVYNNFVWPNVTEEQKIIIRLAMKNILYQRNVYSKYSLARLYNKDSMPKELLEAHHRLDYEVDVLYKGSGFENDKERIDFLYELYKKIKEHGDKSIKVQENLLSSRPHKFREKLIDRNCSIYETDRWNKVEKKKKTRKESLKLTKISF